MINIYGDFRRLLVSALDDLVAEGVLPPGLDFVVAFLGNLSRFQDKNSIRHLHG